MVSPFLKNVQFPSFRYDSELHFAYQNRNYLNPAVKDTPHLQEIFWRGKNLFNENKQRRTVSSLLKKGDYNNLGSLGELILGRGNI